MSASTQNMELRTRNSRFIQDWLVETGTDVCGIADMAYYDREVIGLGTDIPAKYPFAVSFGLVVSRAVLDTLDDGPTLFYLHHYRQVNYRLDMIAYLLGREIERMGYGAIPLAASQLVDWKNQKGHVSHKHIGQLAGVGWIGRNNLLVHPQFGARVRYNTVLTDMLLMPDEPARFGCGSCAACAASCPASAIKERPEEFDHHGCFEMLTQFKNKRNLGHHICGLCIKACGGRE